MQPSNKVGLGLMVKLTDLGFSKGVVFEVIVTTNNENGTPNAAPMGAVMKNPQNLSLNLYNSSLTCYNLKANKCAVINLTDDIEAFYKTAFKEANPNGKLPQDWFKKADTINAPRLRLADANIDVTVTLIEPIGVEKSEFSCNIERINASKIFPKVYSRARSATLEAIIHATRIKVMFKDEEKKTQIIQLLGSIEHCNNIVKRTAPSSVYSAVMADLMKRIDSWSKMT
jgi:uncharacterized protein